MLKLLTWRNLVVLIGFLIAAFLIRQIVWMAVAGPVTVLRNLRYGDTDIDDYSHYPGRQLIPSQSPFSFDRTEDEIELNQEILSKYGIQQDLGAYLEAKDSIAFLVIKDDTILYERYYQGHTPSAISQLFSATKSWTSALIGMAIEDGYLDGVDQPITDFIPELSDEGFSAVTIHHLLTMMSGSSYQENDDPFGEHVILNYTPKLEKEILRFKLEVLPGTVYRYKSGDNALLGLALDRALGSETISEYVQRRLWSPLGMQDEGVWTIDHEDDGLEKTWCCLATSARDLAKFGRLYLNQGDWNGHLILSANWIEQSTQVAQVPETQWPNDYKERGSRGYSYQWWLASEEDGDYFALGKDGQFLYVNPTTETVIVRLGWSLGEFLPSQWVSLFQDISRAIK